MQKIKALQVTETVSQLRIYQRRHSSRFKPLQMLLLIKQQVEQNKYRLAALLGCSQSSVTKWRKDYLSRGIAGILTEKRGGHKRSKINETAENSLASRLNNPKEGFRSFTEIQQWLVAEFDISMNYHAINKHVKRKYGGRLKVSRKSHVQKSPADEAVFKKPV